MSCLLTSIVLFVCSALSQLRITFQIAASTVTSHHITISSTTACNTHTHTTHSATHHSLTTPRDSVSIGTSDLHSTACIVQLASTSDQACIRSFTVVTCTVSQSVWLSSGHSLGLVLPRGHCMVVLAWSRGFYSWSCDCSFQPGFPQTTKLVNLDICQR